MPMDDPRIVAWLLVWQDFTHHQPGLPHPLRRYRRFKTREAALLALRQLQAAEGSDIAGIVVPRTWKGTDEQSDFGFPAIPKPERCLTR
jgi:hypothetical protein